jgi:hypothetical protein
MTEKWPLKRIRVGRRFRRALGDHLRALAESIEGIGLLHPVVVTPQGRLVAGRRRLEAVRLLGWRTIPQALQGRLYSPSGMPRQARIEVAAEEIGFWDGSLPTWNASSSPSRAI